MFLERSGRRNYNNGPLSARLGVRDDVDARSLSNNYPQILGQIFTHEMKPMEVEILVAEVGATGEHDQLFHILYDGTVVDERRYSVLGGDAEAINGRMAEAYADDQTLEQAVQRATAALGGPERALAAHELEVAATQKAVEKGLSLRATVPDGTGMIFVFPDGRCRNGECLRGTFYTNAPPSTPNGAQMETFILDLDAYMHSTFRVQGDETVMVSE